MAGGVKPPKHPLIFAVSEDGIRISIGEWSKVLSRAEAIELLRGLADIGYPAAAGILRKVEALPCA